jgi:hypothetical protein
MKTPAFPLALLAFCLWTQARADTFTYPQLVNRMTDLEELAKPPLPGERTSPAFSYDRESRYDAPVLKVSMVGKNPASKGVGFGLDYLKLIPTP